MTPTVNQVERRPTAVRSFVAGTATGSNGVRKLSVDTRPVGPSVGVASVIGPFTLRAFTIDCDVIGTGPHEWYGERSSYGSVTDTRYGTALPVQPAADSVR